MVFAALKKLEEEGLIQLGESFYRPSRVHIQMEKAKVYEFQVANARFDPVIKTMLRIYGAELFTDFIPVSESVIAQGMKGAVSEVRILLDQLLKLQVFAYEPASDKPRITFLLQRQDADHLPLNHRRLIERRDLALSKAEAMIHFTEQPVRCRMQVVLEYFDEKSSSPCGKCDVCIERKKSESGTSFSDYALKVEELITTRPMTVDELEDAANPEDHDLFIEVVRDMVERGMIRYDDYWVLRLVQ